MHVMSCYFLILTITTQYPHVLLFFCRYFLPILPFLYSYNYVCIISLIPAGRFMIISITLHVCYVFCYDSPTHTSCRAWIAFCSIPICTCKISPHLPIIIIVARCVLQRIWMQCTDSSILFLRGCYPVLDMGEAS
jgi:hypothetical protein